MTSTNTTRTPGWYHYEGDPDGTVRYWDSLNWSDAPRERDDPEQNRKRRPSLKFVGKPNITVTPDGLQLEIEVLNHGPASVSATVEVRLANGDQLVLSNPEITVGVGKGPVSAQFSLPAERGLTTKSKVQVGLKSQSGATITASSTGGIGLGTAVATIGGVTIAAGATVAVIDQAFFNDQTAEQTTREIPTTTVEDPVEEEVPLPTIVVPVDFPAATSIDPLRSGDPNQFPLGAPDGVTVELGPEVSAGADEAFAVFGVDGGTVAFRDVSITYQGATVDLGPVAVPVEIPIEFAESVNGAGPVFIGSQSVTATDLVPLGTSTMGYCFERPSGDPVGGLQSSGPGELQVLVGIENAGGAVTPSVRVVWAGPVELEFLPGVDPTSSDNSECEAVTDSQLVWE